MPLRCPLMCFCNFCYCFYGFQAILMIFFFHVVWMHSGFTLLVGLFISYKCICPSFLCFPLFLSVSFSILSPASSTPYLCLISFRKQSGHGPVLVPLNSTIIRFSMWTRVFEKPQTVRG